GRRHSPRLPRRDGVAVRNGRGLAVDDAPAGRAPERLRGADGGGTQAIASLPAARLRAAAVAAQDRFGASQRSSSSCGTARRAAISLSWSSPILPTTKYFDSGWAK